MAEVKLHGARFSPFYHRVKWALKLKGIPFEYIEEDYSNKTPQLLQYNPIHKKIPVLVHGGKPICESMNIVQYIDEIWPHNSLLPADPYERSVARFWVTFAEDKAISVFWKTLQTSGEEQKKAFEECLEMLRIVEEHCLGEKKFLGGDNINIVDIALGSIVHWLGITAEIAEFNLFEAEKFPLLHVHAWIKNFKEVPVIKENLAERDKTLAYIKAHREKTLGSS
ncbi:putative Glutathione s-transferase [Quillaja saponaria]|uniref:Glutathione-dependent dehydroascorbate reductase n=1 Tax=Quillaja saponaria TaxID=32244 RepID=A0AAD7QDY1_QUISA|nr:putative Glutathione s-transferase [Quillaja saponaria]